MANDLVDLTAAVNLKISFADIFPISELYHIKFPFLSYLFLFICPSKSAAGDIAKSGFTLQIPGFFSKTGAWEWKAAFSI